MQSHPLRFLFESMNILKYLILLSVLLSSTRLFSQSFPIKKGDLIGEWYSSNDDSLFFKADTLVLLKRTDSNVVLDRMCVSPDMARERGLLNCMEFVNLRFKPRNRFDMWLYEGYSSEVWLHPMRWHFDEGIISIDTYNSHWTFQIIQIDTVRFFDRNYSFFDKFADPRLKLIRVSPDSIVPISLTTLIRADSTNVNQVESLDSLLRQRENILRTLKREE